MTAGNPFVLGRYETARDRVARVRLSREELAALNARTDERTKRFIAAGCPGVPDAMRQVFFAPDAKS